MTKDKDVFTQQLEVLPDPRSTATMDDRKAQWDLSMKLYNLLGDMTFAVEKINGVRLALDQRASSASPALKAKLQKATNDVDTLRKKIVATKEGGMITGEERLRENLADLYGSVVFYDGRPSQMQADRAEAISHELADVVKSFDAWTAKELPGINASLGKNPIHVLTREEWEKQAAGDESEGGAGAGPRERDRGEPWNPFERD
jgi:hypothetical protein